MKLSWPRCREYLYPDLKRYGDAYRCQRNRWHRRTHEDPNGDTWEGSRR